MLARLIEASGIPTVTVSMMPVMSDKHRSSRTLGVEFPFGHSFGMPHDPQMQARTLRAALDLLVDASSPETRIDHPEPWPVDRKVAYKAWQPSEPSPIVAATIDRLRQARRDVARDLNADSH